MPNFNKLHSFDEETLEILNNVPKNKRSEYVREGIKLKHYNEMNNIEKPTPQPEVKIIG